MEILNDNKRHFDIMKNTKEKMPTNSKGLDVTIMLKVWNSS